MNEDPHSFLGQLHGKKLRGERRNQECFRTKCRKLLSVCVLALERVQNPMVVHKVGVAQLFLTLPFFISLWDLFLVVYGLCFSPLYYLHFICCKDNVPQSQKTKGGWWQASCFFIIFREWLLFAKYVTHSCILQSWNLCSWESNNNNKKCCLVDNKLWVGCGLCGCPPGFLHQKSYPWSLVVIRDACQPQLITLDVLGSLLVQKCVRIWCALLVFVIRWESSSYVFPCIYFCGSISWRSVSQKPSACGRQLSSSSLLRVGQNAEYLNPLSPSEVFIGGKAFVNVLLRLI